MDLNELALLVKQEHEGLLSRWRKQVRHLPSAQQLDVPTLNDHIPSLLDELVEAFKTHSTKTIPEALSENNAQSHGLQRLQDAFDIGEVVAEYNILRGCIHDLAHDNGFNLQGRPFHILNGVFDHAIGAALQAYANQRAREIQMRREEYLAFVAHDLRTPLFAISLAERVLKQTLPKQGYTPDSAKMLKILRRSLAQLEGLVNKVLEENSNLETEIGLKLERREFDLWPLVEALIEEMQAVAKASDTKLTNAVPDDLVIFADAGLLKRVFQNLIANAIKYTPGGTVVVDASESDAKDTVECSVRDNGTGIPAELLGKIFDKGETDSANPGGVGLGLAIVQTFTEAHGGKVAVETREGQGSVFHFCLPVKGHS